MKITQQAREDVAGLTAPICFENNPNQAAHAADLLAVFDDHLAAITSLEQNTADAINALNLTDPMILTLIGREVDEDFRNSVQVLSDSDGQEKSEADKLLVVVNAHLAAVRSLELETFAKIDNDLSHIVDPMVTTHINRLIRPE
jgi:hypothetical protein